MIFFAICKCLDTRMQSSTTNNAPFNRSKRKSFKVNTQWKEPTQICLSRAAPNEPLRITLGHLSITNKPNKTHIPNKRLLQIHKIKTNTEHKILRSRHMWKQHLNQTGFFRRKFKNQKKSLRGWCWKSIHFLNISNHSKSGECPKV